MPAKTFAPVSAFSRWCEVTGCELIHLTQPTDVICHNGKKYGTKSIIIFMSLPLSP